MFVSCKASGGRIELIKTSDASSNQTAMVLATGDASLFEVRVAIPTIHCDFPQPGYANFYLDAAESFRPEDDTRVANDSIGIATVACAIIVTDLLDGKRLA